jgi:hypothetical protein
MATHLCVMDFFTSRQTGVFDNINYGTWAELSSKGQSYQSRQGSYSDTVSTFNGSGSTYNSQESLRSSQYLIQKSQFDSAESRNTTQYALTSIPFSSSSTYGFTNEQVIKDTSSYIKETVASFGGGTSSSGSTFINTQLGYATGTIASTSQVGLSSLTQNTTGNLGITSTGSYSISTTLSTTGSKSSYSTSFSRWETIGSNSTVASSQRTTFNTNSSLTYAYTTSTQGSISTSTITNHFISPYVDTVILANAGKNSKNYNIGNQIWTFSNLPAIPSGSTFGRFSQLFSSTEADYLVLPYQSSRTAQRTIVATAITLSQNTRTVTHSSAGTIVSNFTSYNGVEYSVSANQKTVTITRNIGDVSTSISGASTVFYSTSQVSGYDYSNSFTTSTETFTAYTSSRTITVNKFWNSAESTEGENSRKTTTDEILYSYYLTSGTDYSFVGYKKTTTTNAYWEQTTITNPVWIIELNPTVKRYTTSSISNFSGGYDSTGVSVAETSNVTLHTITNYYPYVWTNPNVTQENVVVYKSPPIGYAGAGGNITLSNLAVYSSINIGLISGGTYGTDQTLNSTNLPTALAYDNVTIFPDSVDSTNFPAGAYAMRYISTAASIGSRLVGITWSTTTQIDYTLKDITGGTTATTTQTNVAKPATYSIAPVGLITGDFYSSGQITFNTNDVRMSNNFSGGFALGNNAIGNDYTVSLGLGYVAWTAYDSTGSVSSNQSQGVGNTVSFTVPSSLAIVLNAEPILSMSWIEQYSYADYDLASISQSYQYFPT